MSWLATFPALNLPRLVRPAIVLSNELYHRHRPDVIVGFVTTQAPLPVSPTDCEIRDWKQAGLHQPSYFRLFLATLLRRSVREVGTLSVRDWNSVLACFNAGFAIK